MQVNFEPPQYNEIELDIEEVEEGLRLIREQKFYRLQREAYLLKLNQVETYVTKTAEEYFQVFKENYKFHDEAHERRIKQLCCYFANDQRFNGDLTKGLLLMGVIGNGKTTLMKLFSSNQNHSFRAVSMLDISFDYKNSGEAAVKEYYTNYKRSANIFGGTEYGFCFDDLGTEECPARHFGESKNIFAEIIQTRYNNRHTTPFNSTHATTNKNEADLLELYGNRVYDRMKEMFNVFVFDNPSFR